MAGVAWWGEGREEKQQDIDEASIKTWAMLDPSGHGIVSKLEFLGSMQRQGAALELENMEIIDKQ